MKHSVLRFNAGTPNPEHRTLLTGDIVKKNLNLARIVLDADPRRRRAGAGARHQNHVRGSLLDISGLKCSGAAAELSTALWKPTWRAPAGLKSSPPAARNSPSPARWSRTGENLAARCEAYNVITRERYLGKVYRMPAPEARRMAHQVADDIIQALCGHPGMSATRIVMVGNRTGQKELYICDSGRRQPAPAHARPELEPVAQVVGRQANRLHILPVILPPTCTW